MPGLFPDYSVGRRTLFLDMNAFYASVEQQERPELRGRAVGIVPVLVPHTCCIAASYEAKGFGVKTGTGVQMARSLCPDIELVEARPALYLDYHARLLGVLRQHFTEVKVLSVDEVACNVPVRYYTDPRKEADLACRVKAHLQRDLGERMTCSVGVAPNVFLAKVAAERKKPDGLTVWTDRELPEALFACDLSDLPGVGPAMRGRLRAWGILTVEQLFLAPPEELRKVWGSVVGERWHWMLRGSRECDYRPPMQSEAKKSVGHSNVLAPEHRSRDGAVSILEGLACKALARLRSYKQASSTVSLWVKYRQARGPVLTWSKRLKGAPHSNHEAAWMKRLRPLLAQVPDLAPEATPLAVGLVFDKLLRLEDVNLNLFSDNGQGERLAAVVDALNRKHGAGAVGVASAYAGRKAVPHRIPFGAPDGE